MELYLSLEIPMITHSFNEVIINILVANGNVEHEMA